jgi:hypothetical protein
MSREENDYAVELFMEIPPYPFSYDVNAQQFHVGAEAIELKEFSEYDIEPREPISREDATALIDESALLIHSSGGVHMMPRLHRWLTGLEPSATQEVREKATDALIDSYAELSGVVRNKLLKGTHWGFSTSFIRPGHLNFLVVGDCACYGVGLYGTFREDAWHEGFASFEFHNIDWPAQRVALMAGAGAVARMCEATSK